MGASMQALEAKLDVERDRLQQFHSLILNLSAQISSLSVSTCEYRSLVDSRIATATDENARANDHVAKLRLTCDDLRRVADDATDRSNSLAASIEQLRTKFEALEASQLATDSRFAAVESSVSSISHEVASLREARKNCACCTSCKSVVAIDGPAIYNGHTANAPQNPVIQNRSSNTTSLEKSEHSKTDTLVEKEAAGRDEHGEDDTDDKDDIRNDMWRAVEESRDSISSLKSRVRRVESQMTDMDKQLSEAVALNAGFEQAIRASVEDVQKNVATLFDGVRDIKAAPNSSIGKPVRNTRTDGRRARGSKAASGGGANSVANTLALSNGTDSLHSSLQDVHNGDIEKRLSAIEGQVRSLKRLIESNLRNQSSAEAIVREQVSLITKHVCMAMRQYTARRISENNTLIDQTLRERIPEYAKNGGQFVLVRGEQPGDANDDSVDIHQTNISSFNDTRDTVPTMAQTVESGSPEETASEVSAVEASCKPND